MGQRTVESFLDFVEKSCLIGRDQLDQTISAIKLTEPKAFADSESLAECLIRREPAHSRLAVRQFVAGEIQVVLPRPK